MSVLSPSEPTLIASPTWVSACISALLIALATTACVNLEEPWKQARVMSGTGGSLGTGGDMAPLAAGGASGNPIALDSGAVDLTTPGLDGMGGPLDGAMLPTDAPQEALADDRGAPGQDGLKGAGGKVQAGAGGSLGTGGSVRLDAAKPDTNIADVPADKASDEAPDAAVDGDPIPGLLVYYACEGPGGAAGTTLIDLSGNENHGTLSVGPSPTGGASGAGGSTAASPAWSFERGKVDNGLALHAKEHGYIALPEGLLAGKKEVTFSVWIKVNDTEAYQRVFDFSTDMYNFMYLATANQRNTGARFRIATGEEGTDAGTSQVLESSRSLPTETWTHLALVLGDGSAAIYVDGRQRASSNDITLRPVDLGTTKNNFIGRSIFPNDPYLDGTIDEYRIYNRALSRDEISKLAGR